MSDIAHGGRGMNEETRAAYRRHARPIEEVCALVTQAIHDENADFDALGQLEREEVEIMVGALLAFLRIAVACIPDEEKPLFQYLVQRVGLAVLAAQTDDGGTA